MSNSMNCSPAGSTANGIFQARILDWVAISYPRGSSQLRDQMHISCVSCTGSWILYHFDAWETCLSVYLTLFFTLCNTLSLLSVPFPLPFSFSYPSLSSISSLSSFLVSFKYLVFLSVQHPLILSKNASFHVKESTVSQSQCIFCWVVQTTLSGLNDNHETHFESMKNEYPSQPQ